MCVVLVAIDFCMQIASRWVDRLDELSNDVRAGVGNYPALDLGKSNNAAVFLVCDTSIYEVPFLLLSTMLTVQKTIISTSSKYKLKSVAVLVCPHRVAAAGKLRGDKAPPFQNWKRLV